MRPFDLGHGVTVHRLEDSVLEVVSDQLELPWTARIADYPGTAVVFDGGFYEVVAVGFEGSRTRWGLVDWVDGEVMRVVFHLDREEVDRLAASVSADRRAARRRWWIWIFAPLLGLAPGAFQRRWRSEWGFPAHGATLSSAILELAMGSLGLLQGLASAFDGGTFLPGPLGVLVVLGLVMTVEGLVRLYSVMAAGEPMGSMIGSPILLTSRRPQVDRRPAAHAAPRPLRTTILTACACLAPRPIQERWASHIAVRPAWLTVLGALAELAGGVVNLERAAPGGADTQLAINLFFMIEGVARLALLIVTGRPVGSLLGIPLAPVLERLIADTGNDQGDEGMRG